MNQPFKKLDFNIDAAMDIVSKYAEETKVPTLVVDHQKIPPVLAPPPVTEKRKPARLKRTEFHRIAVDLPKYLIDEIDERHFKTRKSKRSIITQAFKDAGYKVNDQDIDEDGRRES